jgi:hypothetical protein
MNARLLRNLAKLNGLQSTQIYRKKPDELLEMLVEYHADIKKWDDAKLEETVKALKAEEAAVSPKTTEEGSTVTKAKTTTVAPKNTPASKKTAPKKRDTTTTKSTPKREAPARKRGKKNPFPAARTPSVMADAKFAELETSVDGMQAQLNTITTMLSDIALFLSWYHNTVDTDEPISHINEVDWAACVDAQNGRHK